MANEDDRGNHLRHSKIQETIPYNYRYILTIDNNILTWDNHELRI